MTLNRVYEFPIEIRLAIKQWDYYLNKLTKYYFANNNDITDMIERLVD